jgi:hypothetical protein
VGLTNLLADRDDDPLPADHGAKAERDSDGDFHPNGNELGRVVEGALVGIENGNLIGAEFALLVFHQEAK